MKNSSQTPKKRAEDIVKLLRVVHRHRNTGFNITSVDISIAISKLKKGKSADPDMLCAEHFILGKDILSKFLTPYFNNMSENETPSALKEQKSAPRKVKMT